MNTVNDLFLAMTDIFESANRLFLERDNYLLHTAVSERTLCGSLMRHLYACLQETEYAAYYVDVEYNRNGGRLKTIQDEKENIITITSDLIVHSRGENIAQDNLIAIEMKKSSRPQAKKDEDRLRLQCMTKSTFGDVWSYDGTTLPEHVCGYALGVYYEINLRAHRVDIEYYSRGQLAKAYQTTYKPSDLHR